MKEKDMEAADHQRELEEEQQLIEDLKRRDATRSWMEPILKNWDLERADQSDRDLFKPGGYTW